MHDSVPSPCTRNCALDKEKICTGCYRTMDEISIWGSADDTTRKRILRNAERRKADKQKSSKLKS